MKMLSQASMAILLFPVGLALVLAGFGLDNQGARTGLQVLGLVALGAGVWFVQRLLGPLANDAQ